MMMMYLLGLGSTTHPLPADTWGAWKRSTFEYDGIRYIGSFAPLFVHQYSQAWFDFRDKHDQHADYFKNSIRTVVPCAAGGSLPFLRRRRFASFARLETAMEHAHGTITDSLTLSIH